MTEPALSSGGNEARNPVRAHADIVHRTCLRYVQNRDEANDLTQDVLIKVHGDGPRMPPSRHPPAWLYTVAANHCIDHLRRKKRLRRQAETFRVESRAGSEWDFDTTEDPDEWSHQVCRKVLAELREESGPVDRKVISLRFDLGLNPTEIARMLGVSRAAVAQRLGRIQSRAACLWQTST